MKYTLLAISLILSNQLVFAQYDENQTKWITDINYALEYPDRVFKLDLSNQGLKEIPSYLSKFSNLESLNLSDNFIRKIDDELSENKNLEFIELSGNHLDYVNFNAFKSARNSLRVIWLRDNNIQLIDSTINSLKYLEELHLGGNAINKIQSIVKLNFLTILTVDNNQLKAMPSFLSRSNRIKKLNLNGNLISSIEINRGLRNLRTLDIGDNPVSQFSIAPSIYRLETLIVDWIDLKENWLSQFPRSLKILSMEHCSLTNLEGIDHLKKLQELSIMHNDIAVDDIEANVHIGRINKVWIHGNNR